MTKKEILKALDALPEDATIEDAMERLYLLHKIERGLKQIEEGKTLTQEEVKAQLAKWWRSASYLELDSMKLYKLPIIIEEPSEDSGGKYVAEVPILPGFRAWGDTAAETVDYLQSVAAAFIESYQERGDALPAEVQKL